jgi:hypothetical protein
MKRLRTWLSTKLFKISFWILPNSFTKSKEERALDLFLTVMKSDKFQKFIPMATETRTSAGLSPDGFLDEEERLKKARLERAQDLRKNIKLS